MPTQTVSAEIGGGAAQRFLRNADIPGQWWTLFGSMSLRRFVEIALANNPDLTAAQAALRVAHHNLYAGQGAYYPQVDASGNGQRQRFQIGQPTDVASIFNLYTGQVNVSYTPDVFGGIRRSVESLEAQMEAQRFTLEATYLTLTSNIVVAAVQEASIRGQIDATQKLITIARDVLTRLRRMQSLGQIPEADVVAQEAALAQIEQTLSPLQLQLEQQRHLLTALMGSYPSQEPRDKFELDNLRLPRELPLSIPAKLVRQRPDVRMAEANLHEASANIGVAVAARLPNFNLSGNVGSTAVFLGQLFTPGTSFWTIAGTVAQPIFHGGTLKEQELAARATFDQSAAQYRSTVITAMQNVADVLSALRIDAIALQKALAAERAADRSLTIVRRRLELGDVTFLEVLNAQTTYLNALLVLVQARAARYSDTAALFQALGGGWWHRNDTGHQPAPSSILGGFY